jgi:hypothetical protein
VVSPRNWHDAKKCQTKEHKNAAALMILTLHLAPRKLTRPCFHKNSTIKQEQTPPDSVIAVIFQIIFCVEMHANNVFLFLKNYF